MKCEVVADATKCEGQYFDDIYCNQIDCDVETETCHRI
jgi:hypothetical protein